MPQLYCVRADFGRYTSHFLNGNYIAIGWLSHHDLTDVTTREEIYPLYRQDHPDDTSNVVIGQQVGQIARFVLEIKAGDYVITPDADTEYIYYCTVDQDPSYYFDDGSDGCPFLHRRKVTWNRTRIRRSQFSVPFQNTIRSSLTVFAISHKNNFFETIGERELVPQIEQREEYDYYTSVLTRILLLDDREFEILITHILTALGFERSSHTGGSHDGGVDATGELNIANMAKIKVYVQAKRYALGNKISANTVKLLRQSIPYNGQGVFITTCDYQAAANEVALQADFPRIGLINGHQLVDIIAEHWDDIPAEFKDKLGLKLGLVVM